jgi:hypothetical protein
MAVIERLTEVTIASSPKRVPRSAKPSGTVCPTLAGAGKLESTGRHHEGAIGGAALAKQHLACLQLPPFGAESDQPELVLADVAKQRDYGKQGDVVIQSHGCTP